MCSDRPAVALSIAGTDPSGGAGIQADLKTFAARGVYGTSAITALLAQNTHGVSRVYPIDEDFVGEQLTSVLGDLPVDATKSGMLGTPELVELAAHPRQRKSMGFYTVDPVMVATSGHRLLAPEAVRKVRDQLLPVADLVTPNLPEAALLLGDDEAVAQTPAEMRSQARELAQRGPGAVLVTGGHGNTSPVIDVLATPDGQLTEFSHTRVATANTHGTGCTLSAAVTAEVAAVKRRLSCSSVDSDTLTTAVSDALDYLARALAAAAEWQLSHTPSGAHGPVDHLVDMASRARGARRGPGTHHEGVAADAR